MKNKLLKLFNNKNSKATSFYLVGNLFNKAIVFLTIPIFTRILSTSDYGIVNTYLSWVSMLSVIIGLSLSNSIRNAYNDYKEDINNFIGSIFLLGTINFLVSSFILIIVTVNFVNKIDTLLVIFCIIQAFMTFITNCMHVLYMMEVSYLKKTYLSVIPNVIITILSIILIFMFQDSKYLGRIISYVIVTGIIGMAYLIKYIKIDKSIISTKYWKYALSLTVPLIIHGLSVNILSTSDRTMITMYRHSSETGIYSLVYSISMLAGVFTMSLENVWIPWFTKKMNIGAKNEINDNVKVYIEVSLMIMITLLMVGPEILKILAPKEYWDGDKLIPILILSSFFLFLYSISIDLEYYYKSTKIIAINTIVAALINLVLNFIFIPKHGAIAAAVSTAIAYITSFFIHYVVARKIDKELFPISLYVKPICIMIISTIVSYVLLEQIILRWIIILLFNITYIYRSLKGSRFDRFIS